MTFNKCIHSCDHHHNQDRRHFYLPPKLSHDSFAVNFPQYLGLDIVVSPKPKDHFQRKISEFKKLEKADIQFYK